MKIDVAVQRVQACGFRKMRGSRNKNGGTDVAVDDIAVTPEQIACAAKVEMNDLLFWGSFN
ncbi:MAG: hypothetical protein H0W65_01845 [Sphingomonas sp.]|uniref:hypothetical protein n=1 Tax=Sphingomonas sp. TaxID=28214 RepID=UPI0017E2CB2F|nr:hypothetical protein [Sphingomonas sp.]MBA3666452.1 hypothetical protein [Sphingomonas sp.]